MKKLLLLLCFAPLLFSCEKEKGEKETGTVVFGKDIVSKTSLKGATLNFDSITHVVLTITDASGDSVVKSEKIELYKVNGQILSYPLELNIGSYELTDFYLVDANNNVKYVAPKEGSTLAAYVLDPLNIGFTISANNETKTTVEVMSTAEATPIEFGYAEFDATIVNTFDIFVAAFIYNDTSNTFDLTGGTLLVEGSYFNITQNLDPKNNVVKIKDGLNNYTISLVYEGDTVYNEVFTNAELKAHEIDNMKPLKIYIKKHTVVLQPGAEGKDTWIGNYVDYQDLNFGNMVEYAGISWTAQGLETSARGLIDFDLSAIPSNAKIKEAKLTLYAIANTVNSTTITNGHSKHSGSNSCHLYPITTQWDENSVTWNTQPSVSNEGKIALPESISDMQDYEIDITNYIISKLNSESVYGLMIKLDIEEPYRRLMFGSSDHTDSLKRPKLEITYFE